MYGMWLSGKRLVKKQRSEVKLNNAEVAQLVERKPEELGVGSSTLPLGTNKDGSAIYT